MKNQLPEKPYLNESGIVNLQTDKQPGSHWISYIKKGRSVICFDSFGNIPPSPELVEYFKNCEIKYNRRNFQKIDEQNCGALALQFLLNNS